MTHFTTTPIMGHAKSVETRKANLKKEKRVHTFRKVYCTLIVVLSTANSVMGYFNAQEGLAQDLSHISPQTAYARVIEAPQATQGPKSKDEIREYVFNRLNQELGLTEAIRGVGIVQCESQWRPDIVIIEPNKTVSLGLWQLNSVHNKGEFQISNADKLDYVKATDWTIAKVKRDGNWNAWSCSKK